MTDIVPPKLLSMNQLVLLAYKRAGLLPIEARLSGANMTAKLEHGRTLMDTILSALATQGFISRTLVLHEVAVPAGASSFAVPELLDVVGDAMWLPTEEPGHGGVNGEMIVSQVDLATWQLQTAKETTSSRPLMYTALRDGAEPVLQLWPVPSDAGVMRVKGIRFLAGVGNGTAKLDLQGYWQDWMVFQLAGYLALDAGLPQPKVMLLLQAAEAKKAECIRFNAEQTSITPSLSYSTQWS